MALDIGRVRAGPGVLTFTPDGESAQVLGFWASKVTLSIKAENKPILPEQFAGTPADYLKLGGPVLCTVVGMQWDAPTRAGIAHYAVSSSSLVITTNDAGKKLSSLTFGVLAFVSDIALNLGWTSNRAVPLLGEALDLDLEFGPTDEVVFPITFGLLPPVAGGTIVTLADAV